MYGYSLDDTPPAASRLVNLPNAFTSMFTFNPAGSAMLPGASLLPASVGHKFTWKNLLIGGAVAIAGYMAYEFLAMPPKKSAPRSVPSPSPAAAVAGLFGVRYRRRR